MAKNRTTKPPHKSILRNIQAVVFDFDGVFTDNRVIVSSTGEEFVVCDRGDGMGTGLLKNAGIKMLILSKEQNSVVSARAKKLNLEVIQGCDDKLPELIKWMEANGVLPDNTAYVGNDINDLECLEHVVLGVIPSDAHQSIRASAQWTLSCKGGRGAIRELADVIIDAKS
jgi:YrbI family 3-deoxy-D-manno-octulosonate 8-phosphate phosphatase